MVCEDKILEGRAHCRSVVEIDGNIEKSTNAQEKVRSLSSHMINKSTVLIISYYGRQSYE